VLDKFEKLNLIIETGIIPVIRARSSEEAIDIAGAVKRGGIKIIEITMTVPQALRVLEKVIQDGGEEILVGAGTVLDEETARGAILAGAEFIVSPTLNETLIRICRRYSKIIIPGALTPTEILSAWEMGADMVKVFPIAQLGGAGYIKALRAPLPQVSLMAVGGVSLKNVGELIKAGVSAVGVGGELVDKDAVSRGEFEVLSERAGQFLDKIRQARASHH